MAVSGNDLNALEQRLCQVSGVISAHVVAAPDGEIAELVGEWLGNEAASETEGAAQATLKALQDIVGSNLWLYLKETRITPMDGAEAVIAAIIVGNPSGQETLLGRTFVRRDAGEAAARSVLAALNRRLPFTTE